MVSRRWLVSLLVALALTFCATGAASAADNSPSSAPPQAKDQAPSGFILPAGWRVQPYGYFKFDVAYDDSSVNNGDFIIWANPENTDSRSDDALSFTVRQTRLGARIFAPNIDDLSVMGRIEIDFENPGAGVENKPGVMLRHAYGQLGADNWSFLFGQTTDVVSPLCPDTLNYTVGWFGGNVGYRHPQARFTQSWTCPCDTTLKVEVALSRQIRQDLFDDPSAAGVDDGQDAGFPTMLARVSCAVPFDSQQIELGLSGHFGEEEIDFDFKGDDHSFHTWSINADLVVPICSKATLKGECFWAENFDSFFGGIGQGVNLATRDEIETWGGWAQLAVKPDDHWAIHAGGGIDNPTDDDLNSGDKSSNCFVFTNVMYSFSKYLSTGLEITWWTTGYKNADGGDDLRVQHSWILKI